MEHKYLQCISLVMHLPCTCSLPPDMCYCFFPVFHFQRVITKTYLSNYLYSYSLPINQCAPLSTFSYMKMAKDQLHLTYHIEMTNIVALLYLSQSSVQLANWPGSRLSPVAAICGNLFN